MIKGLILDVDGVLIGGKKGYNWPLPNSKVIEALKNLRKKGFIVSLCTGKGTFAINKIVQLAHLDNVHIGDGGAIMVDILNHKIIKQYVIDAQNAIRVLEMLLFHNIYTEIYDQNSYFIQQNQKGDKTEKHKAILYGKPIIVESLIRESDKLKIVKIMPVADDENQKEMIIDLFKRFEHSLSLQWGVHPTALPYQFGIITAQGISKRQAADTISEYTDIPLNEFLGIGDGMTDWQFMDICGYAGAMGNASQDLKNVVLSKNERGFIGKSVDENGVMDILKHFELIKSYKD